MAYHRTLPQRISDAVGARLSRLGEILQVQTLIYNRLTLLNFHRAAVYSAPGVVQAFRRTFPAAHRYLDVGAGTGAYAAALLRAGVSCVACEHSAKARAIAQRQGVDCRAFDLTRTPPSDIIGPFDVAYCFEVAEHLPEHLGRKLVRFLGSQAPQVVFTAAGPGQLGMGHINCQPKSYWVERFLDHGLLHRPDLSGQMAQEFSAYDVAYWLAANVMIFERA